MLKWLALLVLLCGTAFPLVADSNDKKDDTTLAKQNSTEQQSPPSTVINNQTCPPNAQGTNTQSPHWYAFPEWWLCILGLLTLLFLGWQAKATSDAAKATLTSAKATETQAEIGNRAYIASCRPKIIVRGMSLRKAGEDLWLDIKLANVGSSDADIEESQIRISVYYTDNKADDGITANFSAMPLGAGDSEVFQIPFGTNAYLFDLAKAYSTGPSQQMFVQCAGDLRYLDKNGTRRTTGFLRRYHHGPECFIAVDDPEWEYQD